MLALIQATRWEDRRDSSFRVHPLDLHKDSYRYFLINPNRITEMKVDAATGGSYFKFSDNHRDRREGNSVVWCNSTVSELQVAHDTAYASNFVTLPFFPKNDPNRTPVDTTIDVSDIAYFCEYNPDPDNYVWLVHNSKAFKRKEQLVNLNLDEAEDIVETGTTSTTTTSEAETTTTQHL